MIAVVHQAFGNIIFADTGFFVYLATFQNHLVSHKAVGSPVYNAIRIFQASSQIVCIENGCLGCHCQSFGTHHTDIAVGDRQNTGTAKRCGGYFVL